MTAEADFKRDIRCVGAETGAGSADVVPKDQQNDICECPKCGRAMKVRTEPFEKIELVTGDMDINITHTGSTHPGIILGIDVREPC